MKITHANYQFWLFAVGGGLFALLYGRAWPTGRASTDVDELAVAIDPGYAIGHYNLGVAEHAAHHAEAARAHYAAAEAADPFDHTPCADHAAVALELDRLDEALAEARCAVTHDDDVPAHRVLGRVLLARGDFGGAADALAWAIARAPHDGPTELDLGVAYARQARSADAEAMWRAAVADDPALADAWFDLGVAAMQADRTDDARASFTAAVRVDPKMAKAMRNLAGLEALAGNTAAALGWLDRALALQPDDPDLRALRTELSTRLEGSGAQP